MPSNNSLRAVAAAIALASACLLPASAGNPVKVAYIDWPAIRQKFPEAMNAEALKSQAETQLQSAVAQGNDKIHHAQIDKKPDEEVKKLAHDIQTEISGMQAGIQSVVSSQMFMANQKIAIAALQVAKEKGYDVVVDKSTRVAAKDNVFDPKDDLTDAVVTRLLAPPPAAPPAAKPAAAK